MVWFEQINMADPFGLAAVRSGDDVVHSAQLLLNRIWVMVLGMQGFPRHGHQHQYLITRLEGANMGTTVVPNWPWTFPAQPGC